MQIDFAGVKQPHCPDWLGSAVMHQMLQVHRTTAVQPPKRSSPIRFCPAYQEHTIRMNGVSGANFYRAVMLLSYRMHKR
jgi:hypothetical protein